MLGNCHAASAIIERGLVRLKELPFVANVRGEDGGMVWGLECRDHVGKSAAEWANAIVLASYLGEPGGDPPSAGTPAPEERDGIHLLGPLSKKVIRIAPPLTITTEEAKAALELMGRCVSGSQ